MTARRAPHPFWRRFLLWPAVALVLVNVGALVGYTLPRRLQERTLVARAATLREEVDRERRSNESLRQQAGAVGSNIRDMQRFLGEVVASRDSLSTILEELERQAGESGLLTERRSYSRQELEKLALIRFDVTLPLSGTYSQIMSFLDALERSARFVIVDRVRYQDKEGGAPGLDIIVSAYFAKGAGNGR